MLNMYPYHYRPEPQEGYNLYQRPTMSPSPRKSPYLSNFSLNSLPNNNPNLTLTNMSSSNLDSLNLSRTIVMKNINESITLSQILDHMEHGPIEYIKLVLKPTPNAILQQELNLEENPNFSRTLKVCYISFINCKIALQFQNKFIKNSQNFNQLKSSLNSKYLKIQLNEANSINTNSNQDYIKLKTLNYIVEYGATRCIKLNFLYNEIDEGYSLLTSLSSVDLAADEKVVDNDEEIEVHCPGKVDKLPSPSTSPKQVPLLSTSVSAESLPDDVLETSSTKANEEEEVLVLTKEDINISDYSFNGNNLEEMPPLLIIRNFIINQCTKFGDIEHVKLSINKESGSAFLHFTSIDSAIKTFEYYNRRIINDKQHLEEGNKRRSRLKYDINFSYVNFHKDRCDKSTSSSRGSKSSYSSTKKKYSQSEILSLDLDMDKEVLSPPDSPLLSSSSSPPQKQYNRSLSYSNYDNSFNGSFNGSFNTSFNSGYSNYNGFPMTPSGPPPPNHRQFHNHRHLIPPTPPPPHSHPGYLPAQAFHISNGYSNVNYPNGYNYSADNANAAAVAAAAANAAANAASAAAAAASFQMNPDPFNTNNRTIYLGNLHPNTTIEEIANNVRAGGLVEVIKYHPDKKVCFITFVDPMVALKFYLNHQVLHQLIVHGYDITVGWAKNHSGPLSREISLAVTAGASRNVYIGIKLIKDQVPENKPILPSEDQLRRDFSQFGELEQINFYHNKDCGFLNFLNIADAIKVVEIFELDEGTARLRLSKMFPNSDTFYDKYCNFKVSFAKDRCGNPPKFSFKKKMSNIPGSTYQQYQHLLHNNGNRRKSRKSRDDEEYDEGTRISENQSYMEDTINEEAAMVFGIISNDAKPEHKENNEKDDEDLEDLETVQHDSEVKQECINDLDPDVKDTDALETEENEDEIENENQIENENENENGKEDENENEKEDEIEDENEGKMENKIEDENDDDDDDDEISIIIDSNGRTSSDNTRVEESDSKLDFDSNERLNESRKINRKVYQSKFDSSDSFIPLRRTSRGNGGSANYAKHPSSFPPQQPHFQYPNSSPYFTQQPMYFVPPQRPVLSSENSFNGGYYNGTYPNAGYPGQPNGYRGGYYTPVPPSPHQPPPSQFYYPQGFPQTPKSAYTTSGSQVMSQYLAKSQHDSLLYAASILEQNDDIGEEQDYYMDQYPRGVQGHGYDNRYHHQSKR